MLTVRKNHHQLLLWFEYPLYHMSNLYLRHEKTVDERSSIRVYNMWYLTFKEKEAPGLRMGVFSIIIITLQLSLEVPIWVSFVGIKFIERWWQWHIIHSHVQNEYWEVVLDCCGITMRTFFPHFYHHKKLSIQTSRMWQLKYFARHEYACYEFML